MSIWINVRDKLPKDGQRVCVICKAKFNVWDLSKEGFGVKDPGFYVATATFDYGNGWFVENPLTRLPCHFSDNEKTKNHKEVEFWAECHHLNQYPGYKET